MDTDLSVTEVIHVLSKPLTFLEYHLWCVYPGQKLGSFIQLFVLSLLQWGGEENLKTESEKQLIG